MSVAKFSGLTESLGYPISVNTITDLELGRRSRLEVAELLVLADALDVPPAALLFPELPDGVVRALPNTPMTSFDAVRWVSGEGDLPTRPWDLVPMSLEDEDFLTEDELPVELPAQQLYKYEHGELRFHMHPNTELLALCRQYAALNQRTSSRMMELMPGTPSTPDDWKEQLDRLTEDHAAQSKLLEQLIVRAGGTIGIGDEADQ